jgi:hypothetical protein
MTPHFDPTMSCGLPCVTVTDSINQSRETKMTIRALVWGENVHEQSSEVVAAIYPDGMHNVIAGALSEDDSISVETATLQDPEHGLPEERLASTDVLLWWGHKAHRSVDDAIVERVQKRVWGNGPHCPAFRSLLKDLQTSDGNTLQPSVARGG